MPQSPFRLRCSPPQGPLASQAAAGTWGPCGPPREKGEDGSQGSQGRPVSQYPGAVLTSYISRQGSDPRSGETGPGNKGTLGAGWPPGHSWSQAEGPGVALLRSSGDVSSNQRCG